MSTVNDSEKSSQNGSPREPAGADPRRWRALALLGVLQFMLVLDITIVNVALPKIETSLGFSQAGLAWVVSGYVLMAGGFLLLGGRLADVFGRRRMLLIGTALFMVASAVCGAAQSPGMLIGGRFAQGLGEAFAAPAALGLIALLFTDAKERTKALGIWGGLTGIGGITGYIISGLFTTYLSWRGIFYINVPVALVLLFVVPRLVAENRMVRETRRLDFTGALVATAGLVGVVYGLLEAASRPWGSSSVLLPLIGGVVLLAVTLLIEMRSSEPLIPLQFFANRTRTVANATAVLFMAAFIPYSFLLTLFEQQVLGYSPLQSGLSYLPLGIAIGMGIGMSTGLTPKVGVKAISAVSFIMGGVGLLLTSMITKDSSYLGGLLPGMIILGFFAGATMPAMTNAALHNVTGQDSGLASGVQTTAQQIGSALGLATLVTLAVRVAGDKLQSGAAPAAAFTDGYVLSFRIGAVLLVVAGVLVALLLERGVATSPQPEADVAPVPVNS
ncbi:MFS transporter [Dactylosporangium sp. NPDC051484]|uniref:MFS transporter n=1 Tax=Dactylosporangium sp. NPDC051484 TaxID=3154942 RepID=UPI00344B663C